MYIYKKIPPPNSYVKRGVVLASSVQSQRAHKGEANKNLFQIYVRRWYGGMHKNVSHLYKWVI